MNKLRKMVQKARLAFLGLGLVASGCHSPQPLPFQDAPRGTAGVAMQDVSFYSPALGRAMTYRVYLPAKIGSGRKLPAVYLLHGSGGNFRNWSNYTYVARYAAVEGSGGMILVMVDGGSSYYANAALKPEDRYEDYLVSDLVADVESRFPVSHDRKSRAIIGVSMGGYAAIKLALSRPDLFIFAGGISPAIDVPSRRFTIRRYWQSMRFREIFGDNGSQTRQAADPFLLMRTVNASATPYIYLTAGEQEPLLEPNRRFAALLQQGHFAYEFHIKPGGHDWGEWDTQIPGCFESLMLHMKHAG